MAGATDDHFLGTSSSFLRRNPVLLAQHRVLQQCFDLCVLECDDLLLTLIDHATEGSEQDVPGLEQEGHVRRRKSPVSGADR